MARILWVPFGVLVAVAFGSGEGRADQHAPAKLDDAGMTEGWLYIGRRSDNKWTPFSISISAPGYPVRPGDTIVVEQNALVYGSVDCKVIDVAEFKADATSRPVLRVTADRQGLEIFAAPIECPSVGRAKTVWANVKIPANRLVRVEK